MSEIKNRLTAFSRREWLKLTAASAAVLPLFGQGHFEVQPLPAGPHSLWTEPSVFKRVTLEMSLKPFRSVEARSIRSVCERVFRQWAALLRRAEGSAVMLWTADGSEILEYRGQMSGEIEWARYIGIANPPELPPPGDPSAINIHQQARLYMDHPPSVTYGTLREIVSTLRSVGRAMTGKPVIVGATFDPGPEFARAPFKYERHTEILMGQWVDCTSSLHADSVPYAGFPKGIPQGTPFGRFFGRQTQHFLTDLGFDYIWFSNGFGFSATAWSVKGPIFDGEAFYPQKAAAIREKVVGFWKAFRQECPSFRVETRGSNLSTGADLSASASPRPGGVFFSDWFIRNAVSAGLPLNSVVSAGNFLSSREAHRETYQDTILLSPVPAAGSPREDALLDHLRGGGKLFLYGPVTNAGKALLNLLNLQLAQPLSGELEVRSGLAGDTVDHGTPATRMLHRDILSDGGIDTVLAGANPPDFEVCVTVTDGSRERVFALARTLGAGRLAWVRGSLSSTITNAYLPQPDDPKQRFQAEYLMRYMLVKFGYELRVERPTVESRTPLVLVARSNNGFFFSGYCPSTAVSLRLRFPHGAPLLHGYETGLKTGYSSYHMPRAWHRECRCFVEQAAEGEISCVEGISEEIGIRRRLILSGLNCATVHFYPEVRPAGPPVRMQTVRSRENPLPGRDRIEYTSEESGRRLVARNITGNLLISW